jgi:AraC family ethanolamine operon transcriptional activator
VRWCGAPLAPGSVVRVVDPWELTSSGPVELVCFGVAGAALHAVNVALAGDEWTPLAGNRRLGAAYGARLVERLSAMHRALDVAKAELAALEAAAAELLRIAAHLERSQLATVEPLPHLSRRRAAVRRVEELLDASGDEVPSIPTLCAVAGVSERTLEYAFREQLGMTPVRFLKIRRLNRVRRGLLGAEPGASVTAIALRAGIYDLGRFAGEYRQLFGELPSQTLRRGAASSARPRHAPPEGPEDRLGARRPERGWRRELR